MTKIEKKVDLGSIPTWNLFTDFRIANYASQNTGYGFTVKMPLNKTKKEWQDLKEAWHRVGRRGRWILLRLQEIPGIIETVLSPFKLNLEFSKAADVPAILDQVEALLRRSIRCDIGNPNPDTIERTIPRFLYRWRPAGDGIVLPNRIKTITGSRSTMRMLTDGDYKAEF